MATTFETYTGDGVQQNFTIPFSYIKRPDVRVLVGGVPQVAGGQYDFQSASTIRFRTAPTNGAAIVIRRISEQDTREVEFTNGSVLTEADLNLSAKQLFFMIQENRDLLETIINGTFTLVNGDLTAAAAAAVLGSAAAQEVANRIADIDGAGQLLLDEMMARRVVGEVNDDYTAFILDKDTIIVDEETNETFAQRLTYLGTTLGDHGASITELSEVSIELENDVVDIYAKYGVSLNVDGLITGFAQHNNGTTGTFDVLATSFRIAHPANGLASPVLPFAVTGGIVYAQNMVISGSLLVAGSVTTTQIAAGTITASNIAASTITADKMNVTSLSAITANIGALNINSTGRLAVGKTTAADTTSGIWLGTDGSTGYDFHIGNSTNFLRWDGSAGTLQVAGTLSFPIVSNDSSGAELARKDTDVTAGNPAGPAWEVAHTFTVSGVGTFALRVRAKWNQFYDTPITAGQIRLSRNGTPISGHTLTASFAEYSWTGVTATNASDVFTVEIIGGESMDSGSSTYTFDDSTVDWSSARADLALAVFS